MKKINLILEMIFLLLLGLILGRLLPLQIIPNKYLIITLIVVVSLISIILLLNKIKNKIVKIFQLILLLLLITGLCIGAYYLNHTLNFMNNIKSKSYQIEEYYILVRKDATYQTIKDIKNQTLATFPSNIEKYKEVLSTIIKTNNLQQVTYSNYQEAYQRLVHQEVESLLISYLEKEILEQENPDLYEKVRILEINQQKKETMIQSSENDNTSKVFHVYISGIDIYGDISLVSRSDVNMIATINTDTHQILLTSIPRDYYVRLHGTTGYKDKLTHAGLYGIDMSIHTLEDLLDININYYIRVNFTTLVNLIDEIDGVDVYVDNNFTAWTNKKCKFQIGSMHLNGTCALAYARERYAYEGGDRHRIQNQQDIVQAVLNKVLTSKTLITKYSSILNTLQNHLETNIPNEKIYQLIQEQLDTMPSWTIEQIRLNGYDASNYTYSYPNQKLYVMEPDLSTITNAINKIKSIEKKS